MTLRTTYNRVRKLFALLRVAEWRRALRFGVAAAVEHGPVLARLDCRTVVDIGANRGQFALLSRAVIPGVEVIAFEPLQKPADTFERLFAGMSDIRLTRCAIGPENTKAQMHLSARDDSSSLLGITENQVSIFPGSDEVGKVSVIVRKLSDVLSGSDIIPPALLKIDVQGFEAQVLDGCGDLLSRFDYVYVECSFVELYAGQALIGSIVDRLGKLGFRIDLVNNLQHDRSRRPVQADFLFSRTSHEIDGGSETNDGC